MMMTRSKTSLASLALLCGLGWLVMACPASLDDFCADGACAPRATVTEGGGMDADAAADGPTTDPCIDAPTAPNCLNDEKTALFVRPTGSDSDLAGGTRSSPFKTINAALAKITSTKRRIYVCDGAYFEDLSLSATHSGVSIFGGIDCAWNPAVASKPVIGATANPLKIDGAARVAIQDVAVVAKDAATGSSIAAFVVASDVSFKRVRLVAGTAAKGDVGVRTDYALPNDLNGVDGVMGGGQKLVACPGGTQTIGGKGGLSGVDGETGSPGPDNKGTVAQCLSSTGGSNGAPGASPAAAPGATTPGELTAQGWRPSAGENGMNAGPGQGGGGGAGLGTGTGGGGGAGGCGGVGGGGGKGAGASLALVSFQSTIQLSDSVLQAKNGGPGGAGASGQAGTSVGGAGGNRTGGTTACNGGAGGAGGTGAAGGGGAGGISIGVLSKGSKPVMDDATLKAIVFGDKGAPGSAAGEHSGVDGTAQAVLELQ